MTIPAYTIYGNRPRVFFRDTDKTSLTARTNDTAGWKTLWDNTIIPAANNYKTKTAAQNVQINDPHTRAMVLAFAGWIEETGRPAGGYKDIAIRDAVYLSGLSDAVEPTFGRDRVIALALAMDILYADMTSTERNTVAGELVQQIDRMTVRDDERIDGWSTIDQMCALAGALAGYGHGTHDWQSRITRSLDHWYGSAGDTAGRMDFSRYVSADGGHWYGGTYLYLRLFGELWFAWVLSKGTTIDVWTTESAWLSRIWEAIIWDGYTGGTDADHFVTEDSSKMSGTKFHVQQRYAFGILATKYPTPNSTEGGRHLHWLFNTWNAFDSPYADNQIFDVIFFDRASVTAVAPKNGTPVPASARLFQAPGKFYVRKSALGGTDWEYDDSVVGRVESLKYYDTGHNHLSAGGTMISFKGDRVLLAPGGHYDSYASQHHVGAYQRSWLHSLVPIVYDPAETYHRYTVAMPSDGGQHFKRYTGTHGTASSPWNVYEMLHDAGGEAWLRTRTLTHTHNAAGDFLVADIEPGYRKFYTDVSRCTSLKVKWLWIYPSAANGLPYMALLWFARIAKREQSHRTMIPLHASQAWTSTAYGAHSLGYRSVGKLWVDVRSKSSYTLTIRPPGTPLDVNGYGPNQFRIPIGSDTTTNYKPSVAGNSRENADLEKNSLFVEKSTRSQVEDYVMLLMPTAAADSEPVTGRAWITDGAEPNWYGITIGSETWMIHRSEDLCVFGGSADTTPPAEVTGHGTVARDRRLLVSWTDPADADLAKVRVYKRTSAT